MDSGKTWSGKTWIIAVMAVLALGAMGSHAEADTTYTLDFVFSGFTPAGPTPWATATFAVVDADTVTLTLEASLTSGQFITEWDFNFDPALDISDLSATMDSCTTCGIVPVSIGTDAFQADGDGLYDIGIIFDSKAANRFDGTDVAVITFDFSGAGTFDDTSFDFLATPKAGAGPFHTAAHVQGIPGGCSGWVSDQSGDTADLGGTCAAVPEPASLLLVGSGILGLALAARRFRRS